MSMTQSSKTWDLVNLLLWCSRLQRILQEQAWHEFLEFNLIALSQPAEQHVLVVLLKYYLAFLHLPQLLSRVRSPSITISDVPGLDLLWEIARLLGFSEDHCHTSKIMKTYASISSILIQFWTILIQFSSILGCSLLMATSAGIEESFFALFVGVASAASESRVACNFSKDAKPPQRLNFPCANSPVPSTVFPQWISGCFFIFPLIFTDFPHVNLVQITLLSSQLWTSCSASFWSAYV